MAFNAAVSRVIILRRELDDALSYMRTVASDVDFDGGYQGKYQDVFDAIIMGEGDVDAALENKSPSFEGRR
jgi:hypothetical protein